MVHRVVAPSPLRASRVLVVSSFVMAAMVGCGHHKRTALRPSFGAPVRQVAPSCPTGGTVITGPGTYDEPFASPSTSAEPTAPPSNYDPVVPTRISPPVPTEAEDREPGLNIKYSDPAAPGSSSRDDGTYPELTRPNTSRSSGRKAGGIGARNPRVTLGEAVRPLVDQPDDLFQPPRADRPWRYVVLHHSNGAAGGYDRIDRDHRRLLGWDGCGYHFVIGNGTDTPDGLIEVAGRWSDQKNGVHCRDGKNPDMNEYGIGICLVGNLDDAPPTPRQVASARSLVAYLGSRYNIPADRIDAHSDLADGPTACPGKFFPTVAILASTDLASR